MLTLNLCQKFCPHLIPLNLGESLGDGSDGQVFSLTSDAGKVVKISLLTCYLGEDLNSEFCRIQRSLSYLKENNDAAYARLYAHESMGKFSRSIFSDRISLGEEQDFILYYYFMEKCQKLSEDERKVFHTLLDHEDRNIVKKYTPAKIKNILTGLAVGLDFDEKKVIFFCDNLKRSPLRHRDISTRNIMKNDIGDFKLVDFDRTELE